jgi:succinyl-diaminopimelate desuccinylase
MPFLISPIKVRNIMKEDILKALEKRRSEAIDLLCDLIGIPTVNPPGNAYEECVAYLKNALSIDSKVIKVPEERLTELAPLGQGLPRPSLIATWGKGDNGLHFHGHYDVVNPIKSEQLKPIVQGDRIYGRGTADMKGGLVSIILAIKTLQELNFEPKRTLSISFTPDEETGGQAGAGYIAEQWDNLFESKPAGLIMPEPSSGMIFNGYKGALSLQFVCKGKASHSIYADKGISAFENMTKAAHKLFDLKKKVESQKSKYTFYPPTANKSVFVMGGSLKGREQFNIVPDYCSFSLDWRFPPEIKLAKAKKKIQKIKNELERAGIIVEISPIIECEAGLISEKENICNILSDSIREIRGDKPNLCLIPGFMDIRYFNRISVPSVAYGPGPLEVAHLEDEYVEISKILEVAAELALTAHKMLS